MAACVLLLSGCAGVSDMLHGLVGGEGKIAERVSPSVLDEPPIAEEPPAAPEAPAIAPTRDDIMAVQEDLTALGYRPGPVDGFVGPLTVDAVKAYQADAGQTPDGRITTELLEMLAAETPAKAKRSKVAAKDDAESAMAMQPTPQPTEVPPPRPDRKRPNPRKGAAAGMPQGRDTPAGPTPAPEAASRTEIVRVEYAEHPPVYRVGDTFIWSNGRVEAVLRVFRGKVVWQVDNGMEYAADLNFLIPPASWSGPAGAGEAEVRAATDEFWPLKAGSSISFEVAENGLRENWGCGVADIERIAVPAGRFDSVVFSCVRDRAPPGEWTRRVWHYVPAIRHYVARTDFMPDGTRRSKELLGVRPGADGWPPALKAGLDKAVQSALDTLPAGQASRWTSTGVSETFEIRPGPVHYGEGRVRCRKFQLIARGAVSARMFPAVACRPGEGARWTIPGGGGDPAADLSFATFTHEGTEQP